MAPRWPQEASKRPPRGSQAAPRGSPEALKTPKSPPGSPRDPKHPRSPKEAPKRAPRLGWPLELLKTYKKFAAQEASKRPKTPSFSCPPPSAAWGMRGKGMAATTVAMQRGNCAATTAMRHGSCMATSVARARQPAWQPAWCRAVAAQVAMQLPGRAATVARQWPRCTAVVVAICTAIARHEHGKRRAQHGKSMTIMDHGCLFARSPGVEVRRR